ncbi:MAG: helix-turn-helix transcriptional regulator [Oceanobacillus sp.]|nr:helix-turn-helix transcriptional regulator [Oceanobacillus sp.]
MEKVNVTSDKRTNATAKKSTWWNRKRIDSNMTFDDIQDITGVPAPTMSKHFSGAKMPTDGRIKILCNLFDVDFDEGKRHFEEACAAYKPIKYTRMVQVTTMKPKELQALKKAEEKISIRHQEKNKKERTWFVKKGREVTWWEHKRLEKGISYRIMSEELNISKASLNKYFTGANYPSVDRSDIICDYFGVDRKEGYDHFKEGYDNYLFPEERSNDLDSDITLIDNTKTDPNEHYIPVEPVVEKEKLEPKPYNWSYGDKSSRNIAILKKIYGLVEYDIFREVEKGLTDMNADIFGMIYGKIPYDIFIEIAKEFKYE